MQSLRVAFPGLGEMGSRMAASLARALASARNIVRDKRSAAAGRQGRGIQQRVGQHNPSPPSSTILHTLNAMADLASSSQKQLWEQIAAVPVPLNLGVGLRGAQAHLFGSFDLEKRDDDDLVVLRGGDTHVHVDWTKVLEVKRTDRYGFDCITFFGTDGKLFELWPEDEDYRYPEFLIANVKLGCWSAGS